MPGGPELPSGDTLHTGQNRILVIWVKQARTFKGKRTGQMTRRESIVWAIALRVEALGCGRQGPARAALNTSQEEVDR